MTKWSLAYELLRTVVRQIFRSFYSKIESSGNENIPENSPTLFAANHQNALMDPLGILFTSKLQTVFLTRADIFENPILLKIFTFMKMLPVYRIKDGKEALKNNERIFNASVVILEANMSLALFPEATHTDKRHLRPIKKAVPRIAFLAEAKNDFNLNLQIIPVGIYYENYQQSNSNLFIKFGKPIMLKEFKDEFLKNEQKGYKALREKLQKEIIPLIIHEPDMDNYDLYEGIRIYYRPVMLQKLKLSSKKLKNSFEADQTTINKLKEFYIDKDNDINELNKCFFDYANIFKQLGIPTMNSAPKPIMKLIGSSLLFIMGFPIFLFGFLNNYVYYRLITTFLKKVKDPQFHSSIKFAISLLISFVLYPIHGLIFWAISGNGSYSLVYTLLLPLTALFANKYRYAFMNFKNNIIYWKYTKSSKSNHLARLKTNLDLLLEKNIG